MNNIENNATNVFVEEHTNGNGKPAKFRFGINPKTGKLYASVSSYGFQHRTVVKRESELNKTLYNELDQKNKNKKYGNKAISFKVDDSLRLVLEQMSSKEKTRMAVNLQLQADRYQDLADTVASC